MYVLTIYQYVLQWYLAENTDSANNLNEAIFHKRPTDHIRIGWLQRAPLILTMNIIMQEMIVLSYENKIASRSNNIKVRIQKCKEIPGAAPESRNMQACWPWQELVHLARLCEATKHKLVSVSQSRQVLLHPSPSIVYIGGRGLSTHSNAIIKYSLINYFEFCFLLNNYLLSKFLYKKENFQKKGYETMFYMRLKMRFEQCKKSVKKCEGHRE